MASNPQLRRVVQRLRSSARAAVGGPTRFRLLATGLLIAVFSRLLAAAQLASLRGSKAHHETVFLTSATETPQSSAHFVRKPSRKSHSTRHRLVGVLVLLAIAALAAVVYVQLASAAVTVTAATGGTNITADNAANAATPAYTALGNIVITEGAKPDFAVGTNTTLILTAPANWEFQAATCSASFVAGKDITAASCANTTSTLTVTLTAGGTAKFDTLTISGVNVRPTNGGGAMGAVNILRTSGNPGTETIAGITNDVTNFGTLSMVVGAVKKLQILLPGESNSPGAPASSGKSGAATAQTAGTAFNATVNAVDQFWNLKNTITDTVHLASNDANAILAADTALVAGTASMSVTLKKATATATVTASDVTTPGTTANTSSNLTVNAAAFSKLQILAPGETASAGSATGKTGSPSTQTAGSSFTVTVNAVDAYWNVIATAPTDAIAITSSNAHPTLPANANLASGTKNFTVTLNTAAASTVTATDATDGTKTANTSASIPVNPGVFTKLQILVPGESADPGSATGKTGTPSARTAGTSFTVTVNGVDANWNVVSTVTDTAAISSSDANFAPPANAALVAGTKNFTVSMPTAGSNTLTATNATDGTKTANTSPSITVGAGAFAKLQILMPGETASPGSVSGKTGTPSARTAGSSFSITVNAVDANWNLVSSTDTVSISSSDTHATLPANAALVAGTKTFTVTLNTAGSKTVTATDATDGTKTANTSPATTVNAGAFTKLQILMPGETADPGSATGKTGTPSAQTAGSSFTATVNAVDANWNVVSSTDTVAISSSDTHATLPANAALVAGTKNFTVTLNTAGSKTVTATDATDGTKTANTSPATTVNTGAFAKLQILLPSESADPGSATGKTGTPSAQTAGSSFSLTVNAVDANWNVVSSTDTVAISSSDGNFAPPANAALVAGTKTFTVTLPTAGSSTLTASDATDGTKTANSSPSVTVNAGAFAKLQILLPGETASPGSVSGKTGSPSARTAGSSFTATVNAVDANWNVVSSTDTVSISSSDTHATLPANAALVAGTKNFTVTLNTAGSKTVTATDATDGTKTANTSPATTVNAGAFAKLQILLPGESADPGSATGKTGTPSAQTAGSSFTATVNAVDANWNVVSSTDMVAISSSDSHATLPANAALVAGTKNFTVTLNTAGSKTVTATDATDGTKTANTSPATTVSAGAFAKLQILLPGETADPGSATGKTGTPSAQTAGSSFTATVNAVDANWNVVSSTDTVSISSSDAHATLPANAALVAGTKNFTVTLNTAGSKTVTATDATDGTMTANTSPATTVNAGAFAKLQILLPGESADPGSATGKTGTPTARTAGSSFTATVNAVDANWNVVSSTDTVAISSSDGHATLPANAALVAGTKNFTVTLNTAGSKTVTATDATDGTKTANTSPATTVNAGAFAKLQILLPGETADPGSASGKTGSPSAQTAGSSFTTTVNAVDANWNVVSSTDTVAISSSDANFAPPANAALVAGTKTFTVTLPTAGSSTLTASDATDGTKTANSSPATTVNAGAFAKLQILLPGETASPGSVSGKTGSPSARTAGSSFTATVNAVDANWNPVSSTDTVSISSSDGHATLPANAALVAGTKNFTVTLNTAGSRTVTATDATDGSKTANTSPATTVNAGAFTKLQILLPGETADPGSATGKTGTPSTRTAGASFTATVNAVDANWNPVSSTDTVSISSSDTHATLPANAALVAGTKNFTVTLNTAGSSMVTATDATDGSKTANTSPATTVNAGAFAKLQILLPGETADPGSASGKTGTPSARTAGSSFTATANAVDANWNLVSSTDTVSISSSDGHATLPANAALVAGTKSFTVTLNTAGSSMVTAIDATDGSKTANTSPATTVNAGAFAKLQILLPGETADPGSATGKTGTPSARTAGSSFTATVNAVDANWNPVSSTDTVSISSSDTHATLPANAALVAGTKNFTVTLNTSGAKTVTGTDATDGTKTANTSPATTVNAGAFAKLQILLPGETADPGSATGKTGTPTAQTAGASFTATVNAVDANWNPVSSTDTVSISSSDTYATLPANAALVAGTKNFTVTLNTAGSKTVTATDATDGTKTANTSPATTVNAGGFAKLQILLPGESADPGSATGKTGTPTAQTAGASFTATVNAVDANWNPVSSTDTVAISSSDSHATLPANAALVAGTKNFTVTLNTAGSKTVTATDSTDGTKSANTSPGTTVNAGTFAKLQILMPGETADPGSATGKNGAPTAQTAGSSFTATVNAVDANWNLVSSTDTVAISSSDGHATLPANAALVAGTKNFTVTLNSAGSKTVTATDATDGTKTANTSPGTTVNAGAFTKLQILLPGETADPGSATGKTGSPTARTAGSSFTATVNAVDANWNLVSSTDTVSISSSDGHATLPANAALVAGTKNFTVTLNSAGSSTVTATDATDGSKTANTSPSATVNAGAFAKLQILVPGETADPGSASGKTGSPSAQAAGSSFTVTVNAVDANWNPVSATDTVAISSSDGNFAPPSNAALVVGTKNFTVSLPTAGLSAVTASDATDGTKTANSSPSIAVGAGAFAKLQILMPGETASPGSASGKTGTPSARTAGGSFTATVNAVDANWNLVSSTDTVSISSSDLHATLPANAALVAGTKNFTVTLNTAGSKTVTATDSTDGSKTPNTSPATTVNAGAFTKLQILVPGETADPGSATGKTGTPSSENGGSSFTVTVNAVDANWNPASSTDTVAISSSDGAAGLPANAALVAGTKNFTVTLNTAGSSTVTSTDATDGSKTANTSPGITVLDVTPPTFSSASVDTTTLTLTFSEPLDTGSTPAGSAFTVKRNGSTMADPTNVSISGSAVTLTLASAVHNGDTVTVAYTQPASNRIRDVAGNNAASFGAQAVTNATASIAPDVPALVTPANAAAFASATPTLTATFSDPDTNNTGQLTFRVCSDSNCTTVLGTFSTATGIANGANGSAAIPGGTITSDGTYYWEAKGTDNTSLSSAFSSSRSLIVDTTPPTVSTKDVNGTTLTLTYSEAIDTGSVPAASAYGVHVNGGSAVTPTNVSISGSAVTLTLASGVVHNGDSVTVDYTAGAAPVRDLVANNAANLSGAAVTNSTPSVAPNVPTLVSPAAGAYVNTATPSLTATFSDLDPNNTGQLTFRVCSDASCTTVLGTFSSASGIVNGTNGSASVPGGTISADGTYYWQAKGTDNTALSSAFSSSRTMIVDTIPPAFASASVDTSTLTVTFTEPLDSSAAPAGSAFTVRQNGTAQATPTNVSVSGSTATLTLAAAIHNGDVVTVAYTQPATNRIKDLAGNEAATFAAQSVTNTTASLPPNTPTLISPADTAALATMTPTLQASFSDPDTNNTGTITFRVCSDASCTTVLGTFSSASGIANGANGSASVPGGTITVDGTYYWQAKATDNQNVSSSFSTARSFSVHTSPPPLPTIDSGPAASSTTGPNVTFTFSDTDGTATFETNFDGAGWGAATSPKNYTSLTDGSHTFQVRAKDPFGNTSAAVSRTWTVVATPPPVPTIDSGPAAASYSGPNVSFGFSDTQAGSTFEVRIDGGSWSSATSPKAYTGLTQASHTFDVRALDAYGNTSAATSRTWSVDATPPTVSITAPSASTYARGTVNITSNANDTGGSGLAGVTYQYSPAGANTWTTTPAAWDTTLLTDGPYDLRAIATDNAGNSTTSALITNITVDNTAPTVTLSAPQYVNASDPASFTLTGNTAATDVAKMDFYQCSDASTSCSTGTWNLISTAVSTPFTASWTVPGADGNKALRVVATDNAGNTGSDVKNALVDRTPPSGGSVAYAGGYASGSVTVTTSNGSDSGSGLNLSSASLQRDQSNLGNDVCAAFPGSWSTISSPDSTIQSGKCYRYRYSISDNAGNTTAYTSASVVKVDTTDPTTPTLAYSGLSNAFQTGGTVYFKQGGTGGFIVTATASDPESGIASIAYPPFGAGWTMSFGNYSFDGTATAPSGAQTVTVTNGAGRSASTTFSVVGDSTAPAGGSIVYAAGYHSLTNVTLTLADGTDGGSGVDTAGELLQRASATLTNGTCNSFGAFTTIATHPALSYTDLTVASASCYQYRYVVSDRVGNAVTYTSGSIVKVDADNPTGTQDDPGAYLRGTVTLTATASDTGGSGVASVTFQRSPAGGGTWTTIGTATSSPYSTSFDTTGVADGLYDLRVVVADGAGNTASSAVISSRRVDNTPPSATLNDPGANLRATVTLSATASDGGSGVATTVFQYRSAPAGAWTTTPAAFNTTTGATPDGLYDLRVIVTDNAGNQTIDTLTNRRIDNTPPSASMGDPGSYVRGAVTLTSTSSDPGGSGVATVSYEKSPAGVGSYASVPSPWNTTAADDGLYDFRVVVTDNAGNTATSAPRTNVRVDNTAPTVAVTSPAASSNVAGTVTITTNAADGGSGIQSVTYQFAHAGLGDWAATPAAWDTTAGADGAYDLRATATDRAGNVTTSAVVTNVKVDNIPPTVAFTAPTDASYLNAAAPDPSTLAATATDAGSGVAGVQFFTCSNTSAGCSTGTWTSLGPQDTTAPYNASLPIPADGNRALKAVATDNVGHTTATVINVTVDRTLPHTTILTKPANPSNVATPQFTFSSDEVGSTFECQIDAGAWTSCVTPDTLAALTDGTHTFAVRAIDPAGNTDTAPASFTWLVDLTPPTGTLADPGRNVRGTITLSGSGTDPGGANASGVASIVYQYSNDGTTWVTTPATWDTVGPPAVADGVYQLQLVVTDNAGNVYKTPAITNVRVDNTPPTTSMDDPGANLRGTVNLTAAASDTGSGVTQVDFQISPAGANSWTTLGSTVASPYGLAFATGGYADGLYDFRTTATDAAGNVASGSPIVSRRIDNTPPVAVMGSPGSPLRGAATLTSTTSDTGGSGVASVQYEASRNGGAWQPVSAVWNTASTGDGTYSLHVVVTDVAGNQTTSSPVGGVVVDNTPPTTTSNAPAGWQNAAVTVTLSATDAGSGVSTTQYSLDGGAWTAGNLVVVPAVDGAHTIAYYSVDTAGNVETQHSATVLMQATRPSCPSCSAADYLRGTVTLTANPQTTPGGAPITSVEFRYGATTIGIDTTAPYSADWNTRLVADGVYHLTYIVTDAANNVVTIDVGNKVVDNTPPTAAVGAPTAGALVTGTVSFSATAVDTNLANVEYYVNGTRVGSTSGGPISWNSASVSDGNVTLYVIASDRSGNSTTSASVSVTVDNTSPSVTLSAPGNASGPVTLSASASGGTTSVEFQRQSGGGPWTPIATVTSAPFSTSLNTNTLADGTYSLRAIATDALGHTGTSSTLSMVVDNTVPTGSIATPTAGASVGGAVQLSANASDATSGVGSVVYEVRPTGAASFSTIGAGSGPSWQRTWDVTGLTSGSYDLRIVVTDRAGNVFHSASITVAVDATPPTVALADPGALISGTVTLNATTTGPGVANVTFGVSPAGGSTWTSLGTDNSAPYSVSFDTTSVADGLYDLRATVFDTVGNSSVSVRSGVRIDNHAPTLVSSVPAEGALITGASSVELVASEDLAAVPGAKLDGLGLAAPVLSGSHATFNTGALQNGPHTVSGSLRDGAGKETPFQLHFTIQPAGVGAAGNPPYVEKNTSPTEATTLTTADGMSATMPAGGWPTDGGAGDWVILRINPGPMPAQMGLQGFEPLTGVYDVTARWAMQGNAIHTGFGRELVLEIPDATGTGLPVTEEGGAWRLIPLLPASAGGKLPDNQIDAFYRAGGKVEILSRHLTPFMLVKDVQAPTSPTGLSGTFGADGLTIQWIPGIDNSNLLGPARVYANNQLLSTVDVGKTSANIGLVGSDDTRAFTVVQTDAAGNASNHSKALRMLPDLAGMTPAQAGAALAQHGFSVGKVTSAPTPNVAPGTIASPLGLNAAVEGTPIDLVVSGEGAGTKLAFSVVGTKIVKSTQGGRVAARINVSKAAAVTAILYSPKNKRLATWKFAVKAGVTIVKLRLPKSVTPTGRYRLVWTARSTGETIPRTIIVQVVAKGASAPGSKKTIDIVLVGDAQIRTALSVSLSPTHERVLSADAEDMAFQLTGDSSHNVRVVVVDVDAFGLSLVRDLRTVFPNVAIVALTDDPEKLTRAVQAGATIALPRSAPPDQLAKVVRRLAG